MPTPHPFDRYVTFEPYVETASPFAFFFYIFDIRAYREIHPAPPTLVVFRNQTEIAVVPFTLDPVRQYYEAFFNDPIYLANLGHTNVFYQFRIQALTPKNFVFIGEPAPPIPPRKKIPPEV